MLCQGVLQTKRSPGLLQSLPAIRRCHMFRPAHTPRQRLSHLSSWSDTRCSLLPRLAPNRERPSWPTLLFENASGAAGRFAGSRGSSRGSSLVSSILRFNLVVIPSTSTTSGAKPIILALQLLCHLAPCRMTGPLGSLPLGFAPPGAVQLGAVATWLLALCRLALCNLAGSVQLGSPTSRYNLALCNLALCNLAPCSLALPLGSVPPRATTWRCATWLCATWLCAMWSKSSARKNASRIFATLSGIESSADEAPYKEEAHQKPPFKRECLVGRRQFYRDKASLLPLI